MTVKELHIPYIPALENMTSVQRRPILLSQGARGYVDCCNWKNEYPNIPVTVFSAAHDGNNIYFEFLIHSDSFISTVTEEQGPVSDDSCVEVFLMPPGSDQYFNLEFNAACVGNASERYDRYRSKKLSHQLLESIHRECELISSNDTESSTYIWRMMISVPLQILRISFNGDPIEMRGNIYSVAAAIPNAYFLSWSPIQTPEPDFHQPRYFGKIVLEGCQNA